MNDLFHQLVMDNKTSREKKDDSNDILQMLIQTQKKHSMRSDFSPKNFSVVTIRNSISDFPDLFLTGHTVSFFMDGTETSGLSLTHALYELARNPECQERLYNEIIAKVDENTGQLSYEAFQEIEYLEWTMMEALRMHVPLMAMSKICMQKYTLPKVTDASEPLTIYPGTPIQIPVAALHMYVSITI